MPKDKVRCPNCNQRVKARRAADRNRSSCPNCGAWFSTDDDNDVLQSSVPPVAPAPPRATARPLTRKKTTTQGAAAKAVAPRSAPIGFKQIKAHLVSERFDPLIRLRIFQRLREAYEQGLWDPELLYLGARYAVSLGRVAAARVFIGRLSELLKEDGRPSPAYFPVGLLSLQLATSDQERAALLDELQSLAMSSSKLAEVLRLVGLIQPEQLLPQSPHGLLRDIERDVNGLGGEVLQLAQAAANGGAANNPLNEAQRFAQAASEAYHAGELTSARNALEGILLLDGDQPDVLRNLITVTSEQQDLEAYERYWRRYVKMLLWHIMRDDDAPAAYEELLRFYSKVATITDREFSATPVKLGENLRTPGLLSRWLEAHAGLIWLDSITRAHREQQANLTSARLEQGWLGHLALMKYWCRVFYPEFYRYLDVGAAEAPGGVAKLRQSQHHAHLTFDPALNLLTRFVEWANIGFDLDFDPETQEITDNEHTEKIMALVGCVARVPLQPHVPKLQEKLDTDERNPLPFRRLWQEACSRPFRARRDKYLNEKNWALLIALYGEARPDPELLDRVTPMSRLFVASALCQEQRAAEGFEIACNVLPDLLAEELGDESQTLDWWRGVFNMSLEQAAEAGTSDGFSRLSEQLESVPPLEHAPDFVAARLKEIGDFESRLQMETIMDDLKSHMQEGRYDAAVQLVKTLPEASTEARERKQSLLEQVRLEQVFDQCGPLVRDAKFKEAKALMRKLQVSNKVGEERRDEIMGQIERAEQNYQETERVNKQIDDAIARAKDCLERGAYEEARKAIRKLPNTPDLAELKKNYLDQISNVENESKVGALVDDAVKRAKACIERGAYEEARKVIRKLPNTPSDLAELKKNYLDQINNVENESKVGALVDDAVKRAKACIDRGAYAEARKVIRKLPNTPADLAEVKRNFLAQISKVEDEEKGVKQENIQILAYLGGRGIDFFKVDQIARENSVDKNNPYEYNAFLKAVQKQVRGY